eukprot:scaffold6034_cov80-Skeletonema_marinoi.AAC.1
MEMDWVGTGRELSPECFDSVVVANIIGGDAFRCCRLSLHTLLGYCAASRHHRASILPPHA